jgi:hypothetical protein
MCFLVQRRKGESLRGAIEAPVDCVRLPAE